MPKVPELVGANTAAASGTPSSGRQQCAPATLPHLPRAQTTPPTLPHGLSTAKRELVMTTLCVSALVMAECQEKLLSVRAVQLPEVRKLAVTILELTLLTLQQTEQCPVHRSYVSYHQGDTVSKWITSTLFHY